MPSLTNVVALLGINLVVCAGYLGLLNLGTRRSSVSGRWTRWTVAALFVLLWVPVATAALPIVAYIRGITSDLSFTLVGLACASLLPLLRAQRGLTISPQREQAAVFYAITAAAMFLYPLALGWGNWDAYRSGWGAPGMLLALLALVVACWAMGLRWLPALVALALLAWTAGLLESGNLWDYLIDPWLAAGAIFYSAKALAGLLMGRRSLVKL